MKRLFLAAATMAAVACSTEPTAVRVAEHQTSAEPEGPRVFGSADATTPTTPATTTTEAPTTTTTEPEPAPTTTVTVRRTTTTTAYEVYEPPSPQGRTTGRGSEPPAGDVWAALAECESGGDATTDTGNGYYGAFQFSLATWRSVGETGNPAAHSYGHQLAAAQRLQARSGWGQWPACSRKLGLA